MPTQSKSPWPQVRIARRAADRLRAGHVWVYRSDIEVLPESPGSVVTVEDFRGVPLGTAIYSSASQIALRMIAREPIQSREHFLMLLRLRLERAIRLRLNWLQTASGTDACRLVFGEADELPGIIVDRYGDLVVLQLLTQGTYPEDVRQIVVEVLREMLAPRIIVERSDAKIRELEELPAAPDEPLYVDKSSTPELTSIFLLNGLQFLFNANVGHASQKTGAFLDQRENYAAAQRYAHGRALDVCTYQGGFAFHLARVCEHVTGVDVSRAALEVAEQNLAANREHLVGGGNSVEWIEANAFDLLRDWSDVGQQFDTIVLDPPAFAKSKRAAAGALRGYKELNLRALKMLRSGGTLVTCSCSHHVPLADFQAIVTAASGDANRRVRLLETRGAAIDHPVILTIPETQYLKCLICEVE